MVPDPQADPQPDPYPTLILPLFSISPPPPPHPSGTSTPPLQTTASVPFRWEEQPGKPRPCTDLIIAPTTRSEKCLHLPPRLAMLELPNIVTKRPTKGRTTTSPTTVLDGPGGKSVFSVSTSSFRLGKERCRIGEMEESSGSCGWSPVGDDGGGGVLLEGDGGDERRSGGRRQRQFGSFTVTRKSKSSSLISPSSSSCSMDIGFFEEKKKMKRNSSLSKLTRSHFWATIYEGFKQVVPWRKRPRKESFNL